MKTLRSFFQKSGESAPPSHPWRSTDAPPSLAAELGTEWRSETYRLKMRSFPDALGRSALEEPRRIPPRLCGLPVAVPLLPSAAYRLLLELLWRDSSFCHLTVPYFHASGHVSLLVCDGGRSQEEKE